MPTHHLPTPRLPTGHAFRICIAIVGTVTATAGLIEQFPVAHSLVLALMPAIYMVIAMLCGSRLAASSAMAVCAAAWMMLGASGAASIGLAAGLAILCGEALRRGLRPIYICAPLIVACLADDLHVLQSGMPLELHMLARAFIKSGANTALATLAFIAVPRRSAYFAARSRTRLDHILFMAVAGASALATLGVLLWPDVHREIPASALALAPHLASVTLTAFAVSMLLAFAAQATFRRFFAPTAPESTRSAGSPRWRPPLELHAARLTTQRQWRALKRCADKDRAALASQQQATEKMADELRRTRDALRQRSGELQQVRSAAARDKARFDALMDGAPAMAVFTTPDGTIHDVNRAALSLLGHEPASLRGKPIGLLIPDEHILEHPLSVGETGKLAPTRRIENCRIRAQNGSVKELAVQVIPFDLESNKCNLVLLREGDSTKRALAALEQARNLAKSAHQSRDMFIATMSHEMRTPLHGLIATLDMLRGNESSDESQHQLAIARTSARALLKIANDVLDFTRIGSSQFNLDRRPFSMTGVVKEVVEEARARATSLGLQLEANILDSLPPAFIGDAARLKQIMANLVSNALKFTRQGGVVLQVTHEGRQCCIDVTDTGDGIPNEKRDRIFEPFVQVHSKSRSQVGTGLGLPISRRLAEAMGGELTLLRSGTDGSTFRLRISLESSDELPPEEQSLRVFSNPRGRILVVEDNPANRYVAQALLAGLECPATIVQGGSEALDLLREHEFDLILMDCQMPGMDGYETTRWARRILKKRVPIIAMTANAMATDRKDCLDAGMDDFLAKPFDRRALNDILCKWLAPPAAVTEDMDISKGMAQLPDLDAGVLDELYESLQWRTAPLHQIRASFNDSLKPIIPLLRVAGPAERSTLQRHLHTLLGSSGMVGARQVEYVAAQLRRAINDRQYDVLEQAADDLEGAMGRYNREFERWLARDNDVARARPVELRLVNEGRGS